MAGAYALLGLTVLLVAIAVALPIPFGNMLPVAALVMPALGLMELDGLLTILGGGVGVIALGATGGLVYAAAWGLGSIVGP